ncbi:hypothetical protein MTO96_047877 [Rhipicephalus appendiculatus]
MMSLVYFFITSTLLYLTTSRSPLRSSLRRLASYFAHKASDSQDEFFGFLLEGLAHDKRHVGIASSLVPVLVESAKVAAVYVVVHEMLEGVVEGAVVMVPNEREPVVLQRHDDVMWVAGDHELLGLRAVP